MKRTKMPIPLLDVGRKERVTNAGMKTFREDIEGFMIPKLRECGYDGKLILASEVDKKQKRKDIESGLRS